MKKDEYIKCIEINADILSFIVYMIDNYGIITAINQNYPKSEELSRKHHDYVYFCITKTTRSLLAANELAKLGFREDVMTLVRSAYETYLLLGNAIQDKKFINKAITISLGLRENYFVHPQNKFGKKGYSKVGRKILMLK